MLERNGAPRVQGFEGEEEYVIAMFLDLSRGVSSAPMRTASVHRLEALRVLWVASDTGRERRSYALSSCSLRRPSLAST